jgi:hypothetical protein
MSQGGLVPAGNKYLVVRTPVALKQDYGDYEDELRVDFWYSCAYCSICEAEAQGLAFGIDHYESKKARSDLLTVYSNLMYACTLCNSFKWKYHPPVSARALGFRFFKADVDDASEHFDIVGDEIVGKTPTGEFTKETLNLNRDQLVRLRALRRKLARSVEQIVFGVRALRGIRLDRLSKEQKIRFQFGVVEVTSDKRKLDNALRALCRSTLLDAEPETEARTKSRREYLHNLKAQFSDPWWPASASRDKSDPP